MGFSGAGLSPVARPPGVDAGRFPRAFNRPGSPPSGFPAPVGTAETASQAGLGDTLAHRVPHHRLPTHCIARLGIASIAEGRPVFPKMSVAEGLLLVPEQATSGEHSVLSRFFKTGGSPLR